MLTLLGTKRHRCTQCPLLGTQRPNQDLLTISFITTICYQLFNYQTGQISQSSGKWANHANEKTSNVGENCGYAS